MRTRIAAILLCLLLALSLAGCVHADRTVNLNADGSGTYTFAIGISDQMVSLGGSSLSDSMNKFGDEVKQEGGTYSRYEDNGYSVWKYVRPFSSVSQLDSLLPQTPQANTASGNADTLKVTAQEGFFATTFHVTGTMSLVYPDTNQSARDLLKDARLSFAVTMPNWVSAQHGGNLNGNTVTYTVHYGESATIDVTGGGLNAPHIALVVGGVLLALAFFIVGLILLLRSRRPSKPAVALSPYYMPTQPGQPGMDAPTMPATLDYPPDYEQLPPAPTPTPE